MCRMALPADYHMHTPLCHHAKGEPWELAAQAVQKGLSEIGFSEHNPMIRDDWDDWHMVRDDLELYVCLLYTSPSPRDISGSRMPSSA